MCAHADLRASQFFWVDKKYVGRDWKAAKFVQSSGSSKRRVVFSTGVNIFDGKMAAVNASQRGGVRGIALPLLLDLARKPNFLHDNSVPTMDSLLNPTRGANAPHPFYFPDAAQRGDMVEFLRGLDTNSR